MSPCSGAKFEDAGKLIGVVFCEVLAKEEVVEGVVLVLNGDDGGDAIDFEEVV